MGSGGLQSVPAHALAGGSRTSSTAVPAKAPVWAVAGVVAAIEIVGMVFDYVRRVRS